MGIKLCKLGKPLVPSTYTIIGSVGTLYGSNTADYIIDGTFTAFFTNHKSHQQHFREHIVGYAKFGNYYVRYIEPSKTVIPIPKADIHIPPLSVWYKECRDTS